VDTYNNRSSSWLIRAMGIVILMSIVAFVPDMETGVRLAFAYMTGWVSGWILHWVATSARYAHHWQLGGVYEQCFATIFCSFGIGVIVFGLVVKIAALTTQTDFDVHSLQNLFAILVGSLLAAILYFEPAQ
jgi:hypothetical protein